VVVLAVGASGGTVASTGLIVFPGVPQGQAVPQLFAIEPSGAGLRQLTKGPKPVLAPAFSPSGKRVAFARYGAGIFTIDPDGTRLRRLTAGPRDAYPAWSPNGRRIAFVRPVAKSWRVFVVPSTGGAPTPLPLAVPAGRPTWARQGLLVPTGGGMLRADPASGKVLGRYPAEIDPISGPNSVSVDEGATRLTYVGSREQIQDDGQCADGPCSYGLYLERLAARKRPAEPIVADAGPAAFSADGRRVAFVADNVLTLRDVETGAETRLRTPGITPLTSTPVAWR
jgi:dipeptidyl aminopeptidase/acylaminoacyl peptidase